MKCSKADVQAVMIEVRKREIFPDFTIPYFGGGTIQHDVKQ